MPGEITGAGARHEPRDKSPPSPSSGHNVELPPSPPQGHNVPDAFGAGLASPAPTLTVVPSVATPTPLRPPAASPPGGPTAAATRPPPPPVDPDGQQSPTFSDVRDGAQALVKAISNLANLEKPGKKLMTKLELAAQCDSEAALARAFGQEAKHAYRRVAALAYDVVAERVKVLGTNLNQVQQDNLVARALTLLHRAELTQTSSESVLRTLLHPQRLAQTELLDHYCSRMRVGLEDVRVAAFGGPSIKSGEAKQEFEALFGDKTNIKHQAGSPEDTREGVADSTRAKTTSKLQKSLERELGQEQYANCKMLVIFGPGTQYRNDRQELVHAAANLTAEQTARTLVNAGLEPSKLVLHTCVGGPKYAKDLLVAYRAKLEEKKASLPAGFSIAFYPGVVNYESKTQEIWVGPPANDNYTRDKGEKTFGNGAVHADWTKAVTEIRFKPGTDDEFVVTDGEGTERTADGATLNAEAVLLDTPRLSAAWQQTVQLAQEAVAAQKTVDGTEVGDAQLKAVSAVFAGAKPESVQSQYGITPDELDEWVRVAKEGMKMALQVEQLKPDKTV